MFNRCTCGLLLVLIVLPAISVRAAQERAAAGEESGPAAAHAAAQPEGGHASEEVNPLEWSNQLAIWTGVVFLVLLLVLWRFAWGPIVQGLDKREKRIGDQIAQAEQANQQAKDLLAQYEQRLVHAQDDVRAMLAQARREAEQAGRELIAKAKAEAQGEQQRALRQIDAATTAALKDLADRSATLAVELAGKILHARLKPADHANLINEAVAAFTSPPPSEN